MQKSTTSVRSHKKTHQDKSKRLSQVSKRSLKKKSTLKTTQRRHMTSSNTTTPSTATTEADVGAAATPQQKLRPDVRTTFTNAISDEMLVTLSMNFNNSGRSHQELCDNLRKNNLISTPAIEYAFRKSDRKFFDPSMHPYEDKPHDIGGSATITAAHMHAIALEALGDALIPLKTSNTDISPKTFVDVGSGSGFVTSAMGHIVNLLRLSPKHAKNAALSRVIGVEIHPGLLVQSVENIRKCFPELVADAHPTPLTIESVTAQSQSDSFPELSTTNTNAPHLPIVQLISRDAFSTSKPLPYGPFDAIHCGVAVDHIPISLLAQLKPGGRIVVPIKLAHNDEQDLMLFTRKNVVDDRLGDVDFFTHASTIQQSKDQTKTQEFLDAFFTSKPILRCVFMMAHNDKTVPLNMPAINTAEKQSQNDQLSKFFAKDDSAANLAAMTPEERSVAQNQLKRQQIFEKEAKILKFQEELDTKRLELETTSDEIKKWHVSYVAENDGRKPTLKEMQSDHVLNNMLIIVKELRTKTARLERAIISLQSDDSSSKKH